jgi:hypothetical protein
VNTAERGAALRIRADALGPYIARLVKEPPKQEHLVMVKEPAG